MRGLVLLLALIVAWFSLTKGERKQLVEAGRDSPEQSHCANQCGELRVHSRDAGFAELAPC